MVNVPKYPKYPRSKPQSKYFVAASLFAWCLGVITTGACILPLLGLTFGGLVLVGTYDLCELLLVTIRDHIVDAALRYKHRILRMAVSSIRQVKKLKSSKPRSSSSPEERRLALLTWLQKRVVKKPPTPSPPSIHDYYTESDTDDFDSFETQPQTSNTSSDSFVVAATSEKRKDEIPWHDCPCCGLFPTCYRCRFVKENPSLVPLNHAELSDSEFMSTVYANIKGRNPRPEFMDWFETERPLPEKSPLCCHYFYDSICPKKVLGWPKKTVLRTLKGAAHLAARAVPAAAISDKGLILSTVKPTYPKPPPRDMSEVEIDVDGEKKTWDEWVESNGWSKAREEVDKIPSWRRALHLGPKKRLPRSPW